MKSRNNMIQVCASVFTDSRALILAVVIAFAGTGVFADDPTTASQAAAIFTSAWDNNGTCVQECWDEFLVHENQAQYEQCINACGEVMLDEFSSWMFGVSSTTITGNSTLWDELNTAMGQARDADALLGVVPPSNSGLNSLISFLGDDSAPTTYGGIFLQMYASVRLGELADSTSEAVKLSLQVNIVDLLENELEVAGDEVGWVLADAVETLFAGNKIADELETQYQVSTGPQLLSAIDSNRDPEELEWLFE